MFPFRVYPSVTFNLTRTLVVGASVCVSVVLILVYLYSHNHYQREHLPLSYRLLPNGTKIVVVVEPATNSPVDRWHEKIRAALQTSANFGFIHAFVASISVIVVSELGDKTFFIAAIMAMRHSRLVIYAGAMAALAAMTVLSALLGNIVTNFIPRSYTYYISSVLFAGFGVKMLRDGYLMSPEEGTDEYEEAQHEVDKAENNDDLEAGATRATPKQRTCVTLRRYVSPIFLQALVMTFLAEWGDRSQITTIVLAASENLFGVIVGGTIGHGFCTGLAVIGGRFVAQRISPKTVTLVGGIVFLCFAISAFFIRPDH